MGATLSIATDAAYSIRATEYTAQPRGEARQDQEALLQERPALQEVPRRVQAAREAGPCRAARAACLPGLRERRQEAAEGRARPLTRAGGTLPRRLRTATGNTLCVHGHLPRDRWRRVPGLAPVRRAPASGPPRHLRRQPRNGVAEQHRAHSRARVRLPAERHRRAVLRQRARRLRLPPGVARVADRLPAAAAPYAEGRLVRHAPHARARQGAPRALPARVDERGLRRPADPPSARGLLGPRQPDRPARRLRRGQALRRGADDGLSPPAGRG